MKTVIALVMMSSVAMASTAKTTTTKAVADHAATAHQAAAVANTTATGNNVAAANNANLSINCNDEARYPVIEKTELSALIDQKAVFVVDANNKNLYLKSHIPTAINYGLVKNEFAAKLPADKNTLIVTYCGDMTCSAWKQAAMDACKNGYTNVKHFKAGIKGWNAKI